MGKRIIINQTEYTYGNVNVYLFGQRVGGLRGIDYKTSQKTECVRGAGNYARGIQSGEIEYNGTLTILQSELEKLTRSAIAKGYDSIVGVPFDIVVCYSNTGAVTTDKIYSAVISEMPKSMKVGDMHSEHALPFIALGIEYDV